MKAYILTYTLMVETKIAKYGNSLTVRLPSSLARDMDLHEGDRVILRKLKSGLVIERPLRSRLEARLATVKEREREILTGDARGKEILS